MSLRPSLTDSFYLSPSLPLSPMVTLLEAPTPAASALLAAAALIPPLSARHSLSLLSSSGMSVSVAPPLVDRATAQALLRTPPLFPSPRHHQERSSQLDVCSNQHLRLQQAATTRPRAPALARRTLSHRLGTSREAYRRKRFLVFCKVLFKCLAKGKTPQDAFVHQHAKSILAECTGRRRRHHHRNLPYSNDSLVESLERELRTVVGESHWLRAQAVLELYLEKKRELKALPRHRALDPLDVLPEIQGKGRVYY